MDNQSEHFYRVRIFLPSSIFLLVFPSPPGIVIRKTNNKVKL